MASAGSINNAAKKLLVSQPYLSGMINALEKELGYSIFIRTSQGISCTPQGALFMQHAEKIMSELSDIRSIAEDRALPLTVASYYSRFVTERFMKFHSKTSEISGDRYREMGNMEVIDAVAGRDFSLGIIYHAKTKMNKFLSLAEEKSLEYHSLFKDMGTYLIMTKAHPLAEKEHITNEELRQSSVVFFDDASTVLYMMDHLKLHGMSGQFAVPDRGSFMDALLSGEYLSVINTPYPEDEKLFVLKDLSDCLSDDADIEVSSGYIVRRDHRLTAREKAFLASLTAR